MTERFYAPTSFDAPTIVLSGNEAHHLMHVLRLRPGEQVMLFDGQGAEARAEIVALARGSVQLKLVEMLPSQPHRGPALTLATAVPKGERFRWLVEKTTELGVTRLVPLITERSVVKPGQGKLAKMRQTVVAAVRQSGRNRLMHIEEPSEWKDLVSRRFSAQRVLIAHPSGRPFAAGADGADADSAADALMVCVGPEGGFAEGEIELAVRSGAELVALGGNILRIETAAVAICSLIMLLRSPDRGSDGQ